MRTVTFGGRTPTLLSDNRHLTYVTAMHSTRLSAGGRVPRSTSPYVPAVTSGTGMTLVPTWYVHITLASSRACPSHYYSVTLIFTHLAQRSSRRPRTRTRCLESPLISTRPPAPLRRSGPARRPLLPSRVPSPHRPSLLAPFPHLRATPCNQLHLLSLQDLFLQRQRVSRSHPPATRTRVRSIPRWFPARTLSPPATTIRLVRHPSRKSPRPLPVRRRTSLVRHPILCRAQLTLQPNIYHKA